MVLNAIKNLHGLLFAIVLAACGGSATVVGSADVTVVADGQTYAVSVPGGASAQQAVEAAGVEMGELDRLTPAGFTVVADGDVIQVTRVEERFEIESSVVPFERQTLRNEALPEGESRLLQAGENGLQETTFRVVMEDGLEASRTPVKLEIVQAPRPEIVMIGVQSAYSPVPVDGSLAVVSVRPPRPGLVPARIGARMRSLFACQPGAAGRGSTVE